MISTIKHHVEYPSAGQNTQQGEGGGSILSQICVTYLRMVPRGNMQEAAHEAVILTKMMCKY